MPIDDSGPTNALEVMTKEGGQAGTDDFAVEIGAREQGNQTARNEEVKRRAQYFISLSPQQHEYLQLLSSRLRELSGSRYPLCDKSRPNNMSTCIPLPSQWG